MKDHPTEDAVRRHQEEGFFGPIQRPEALHRLFVKGFLWARSPSGEMKWLYMGDRIGAQFTSTFVTASGRHSVVSCAYRIGDKWYCNGKSAR